MRRATNSSGGYLVICQQKCPSYEDEQDECADGGFPIADKPCNGCGACHAFSLCWKVLLARASPRLVRSESDHSPGCWVRHHDRILPAHVGIRDIATITISPS
jgi:TPP-dependent indolepyruvate ferredoxin oxidoreductase alpha subunit